MSTACPMGARVLIAEDDPSIVVSLEFLLRQAGYEAHVAANGDDAWRALRVLRPDLLLLDVMLPGVSGFEICRRMRADRELAGIRIMMLTARGRESEVAKGLALGADAYVTKPFGTRELLASIRELLDR